MLPDACWVVKEDTHLFIYKKRNSSDDEAIQELDKIMEHYRYCVCFFINMVLDHLLPSIQPQFLEMDSYKFCNSL
jgi:hypothetical protein